MHKMILMVLLTAFISTGLFSELHAEVPINGAPEPIASNITLDFKEADINTVLRVLSLKSKVNIVAGPEVQGTVTIRLENVNWERALEVVLRTYDYVYERDGNIIRVTTREKMAQEPVVTQTFILNYTKASEVQDAVKDMLTERGRIKTAERTNTLVITDIPTNLYRMKEIVAKLDQITPQAFVDSKIVNTQVGVTENLGISWTPTAGITGSSRPTTFPFYTRADRGTENISPLIERFFPFVNTATTPTNNPNDSRAFPFVGNDDITATTFTYGTLDFSDFAATLNWLKSRANTKVISNPRIVVLNNQKAKVQVGEQIPLPQYERNETTGSVEITGFAYRDVGVILNVTPHINSEAEILVDLAPEVSSQGDTIDFGDFQVPSFTVTQATTQVLIKSGETIAIGGLLTDNVATTESRVPFFGDIPVVGKIFRSKRQDSNANNKAETLFFVTVSMVDTEGQPIVSERKRKNGAGSANAALKQSLDQKNVETAPKSADDDDANAAQQSQGAEPIMNDSEIESAAAGSKSSTTAQ